jgi:hypothetical protein
VYDWRIQGNDAGNSICKADGDNFFVVGATGQRILLLKINQYGDTLFTKVIGPAENRKALSITPDQNNNFYITGEGSKSYVVKINSNCEVLWEKYFTESSQGSVFIYSTKIFSDNSLVSCGRIGIYKGYIQKIDTAGNLIWNKVVDGGFYRDYKGLEEDNIGNIVLTGKDFANGHFSKYSSNGVFIYEKSIGTFMPEKLKKIESGFYIGGFNFDVARTDTAGNIVTRKYYKNIKRDEELYDFQMISNNRYIMCGLSYTSLQDTMHGKIIIADTSGIVIHQKLVPNFANLLSLKGIFLTPGGDILFTGFREIKNFTNEDVLIVRTNQYLEGPTVGINNNSLVTTSFQLYQNYPNPFNPSTTIAFLTMD